MSTYIVDDKPEIENMCRSGEDTAPELHYGICAAAALDARQASLTHRYSAALSKEPATPMIPVLLQLPGIADQTQSSPKRITSLFQLLTFSNLLMSLNRPCTRR